MTRPRSPRRARLAAAAPLLLALATSYVERGLAMAGPRREGGKARPSPDDAPPAAREVRLEAPPATGLEAPRVRGALRERLARSAPDARLPVIVRLREGGVGPAPVAAPLTTRARAPVRRLRHARTARLQRQARRLRALGGRHLRLLWSIDALSGDLPAQLVRDLAGDPRVRDVRLDDAISLPSSQPASEAAPGWNLRAIGAPSMWDRGFSGRGVVVASLDTGVDLDHPELYRSYLGGPGAWFDAHGQYSSPVDPDGHGTRSLGVIVAGSPRGRPLGVAPGARWMAARIFDDAGQAPLSAIHAALQWLLDPDGDETTADTPPLVTCAWGLPASVNVCDSEFDEDLALLREAGAIVLFAAGNAGPEPLTSVAPANGVGVLSVGAVTPTLQVARTSSRGPGACDGEPFPTLLAPGETVETLDSSLGGLFADSAVTASGTSLAVGHAVGALALLREAFPTASPCDLGVALVRGARSLPGARGSADTAPTVPLLDVPGAARWLEERLAASRAGFECSSSYP